jgi:hypothetical protein
MIEQSSAIALEGTSKSRKTGPFTTSGPPKPHLVIRVGITGHRREALQEMKTDLAKLAETVSSVLQTLKKKVEKIFELNADVYAGQSPIFRLISPLAEGSDRIAAREARRLDFLLECPFPFPEEEYKKDFKKTPGSLEEFCELRQYAREAVFEMNGKRSSDMSADNEAYEAVGRVVLRQADLLIAIWDGAPPGPGGTGQVAREALARKIPVIWIKPTNPEPCLLKQVADTGKATESEPVDLAWGRLRSIISLPSEKEMEALDRFRKEQQPQRRFCFVFRGFCKIFYWSWKFPAITVANFKEGSSAEWREIWNSFSGPNSSVGRQIDESFRLPFDWADVLADIYADRYRSSFVLTYLLVALAVFAAFLGSREHGWHEWFKVELAMIASILALVLLNRFRYWHDRWIDYRLLAEGFRQMKFLGPFARVTPAFEAPAYLGEADPGPTWFNWYFRAILREAGLIRASVDDHYLGVCRQVLEASINSQIEYHTDNGERHRHLQHRLHTLTFVLFAATAGACILHTFSKEAVEALFGQHAEMILTICAIVFPAFGAAVEGINHQGELERISRRSRAIKSRLDSLASQVSDENRQFTLRELGRIAESFCEIQLSEQTDWRAVFITKEVNPG